MASEFLSIGTNSTSHSLFGVEALIFGDEKRGISEKRQYTDFDFYQLLGSRSLGASGATGCDWVAAGWETPVGAQADINALRITKKQLIETSGSLILDFSSPDQIR